MTNTQNDINEEVYGQPVPEYPTEEIIERGLVELLSGSSDDFAEALIEGEIRSFQTYAEAGVMTNDRGLVLTMIDGSEYQINIGRSR